MLTKNNYADPRFLTTSRYLQYLNDTDYSTSDDLNLDFTLDFDMTTNMTGFENYTAPADITIPIGFSIYNNTESNIKDYEPEYLKLYYIIPLGVCMIAAALIAVFKYFRSKPPKPFGPKECGENCCEVAYNSFMLLVEISLFFLEMYILVVNTANMGSRFQGTQYLIYQEPNQNFSYILNDKYFSYNRESALQFTTDYPDVPYSAMQNFTKIELNTSMNFNYTQCSQFDYDDLTATKTIYLTKIFFYILLFVAIIVKSANVYWTWIQFRYEFQNKWTGVTITLMVNSFSASELGFSFFDFQTDCLNKVDLFQYVYTFMIIFLAGFIIMILAIIMKLFSKDSENKCITLTLYVGAILFTLSGLAVFIVFTVILVKSGEPLEMSSGIGGLAMLAISILSNIFSGGDEEQASGEKELRELDDVQTHHMRLPSGEVPIKDFETPNNVAVYDTVRVLEQMKENQDNSEE
jgi:hypothetical protein